MVFSDGTKNGYGVDNVGGDLFQVTDNCLYLGNVFPAALMDLDKLLSASPLLRFCDAALRSGTIVL